MEGMRVKRVRYISRSREEVSESLKRELKVCIIMLCMLCNHTIESLKRELKVRVENNIRRPQGNNEESLKRELKAQ